jgi:hypothetical protein
VRSLGAAVFVVVMTSCVVRGGPDADGWSPFDGGADAAASPPAPEDPPWDAGFTPFDPDAVAPTTDAGCPALYPTDGTPCVYAGSPPRQICAYVVHGGTSACTCDRLTPESDDLWRCQRQVK